MARYLVHSPIALVRILTEEKAEKVVSQGDKVHPRHGQNFRIFDPLEFIAEVVSHIPNVAVARARRRPSTPRLRRGRERAPRRRAVTPSVIKRILDHLKLWPTDDADDVPSMGASE